jgi:very-short-patch-repair endonuclease
MREQVANPDLSVAKIAARQHGVISIWQLQSAGLGRNAVTGRVRAGRLHRIHRGVYSVGHGRPPREGLYMAAVLACGGVCRPRRDNRPAGYSKASDDSSKQTASKPILDYWGAAVSHRSAAELWGLLPPRDAPADVSIPGNGGRATRRGIRMHRSLSLVPAHVTLCEGIPVTTPARTISDLRCAASGQYGLRGRVSSKELRRAIRQADVLDLPIGSPPEWDRSRSDLERDFLRLCRRHRLSAPEVNVRVGRYLVDFLWRERRLVVETDSYLYHRGQVAFQDDHERDLNLRALGWEVLRLSEKQLNEEPKRVAEVLRTELRRSAAPQSDL